MKAVRIHSNGGPEVLKIDNLEVPKPTNDEVLIKINFASLNHLDIWVRKGIPGTSFPLIMGSDASGTVISVGKRTSRFKAGDEIITVPFRIPIDDIYLKQGIENLSQNYQVSGEHCDGVQAEFVCLPERYLMHKPKTFSRQEAAAFPLTTLTSYHMLAKKVHLKAGDWVLVWGASSGVGCAAIQIAKYFRARVIACVGSKEKENFAEQVGADYVLNYKKVEVGKKTHEICGGVDVVFEHTGEKTWMDSLKALRIGGKIVTCGATTGFKVKMDLRHIFSKQQQIIGSTMGTFQDMIDICKLAEQEKLRPHISKVFSFKEVDLAHRWLESGKNMGKILLEFK